MSMPSQHVGSYFMVAAMVTTLVVAAISQLRRAPQRQLRLGIGLAFILLIGAIAAKVLQGQAPNLLADVLLTISLLAVYKRSGQRHFVR